METEPKLREAAFWLALAYASDLKLAHIKAIVTAWCLEGGQPLTALFELPSDRAATQFGLSAQEGRLLAAAAKRVPEQAAWLARLEGDGVTLVTRADPRYPRALVRWLPPAFQPLLLFGRGDAHMLSRPSAAVIGTRDTSVPTIGLVRDLAALLAEEGLAVVSGFGKGVGQATLSGALSADEGQTIAVLPTGIHPFPGTGDVAGDIDAAIEQGRALLLSPFHPEARFTEAQAIARNKLIMALAEAVFVVTVGQEGVARQAVDEALRMGKAVYVLDTSPEIDPAATGNQALIGAGALPIVGAPDILDAVEAALASALELTEAAGPPLATPPLSDGRLKEAEEPYERRAILDLLSAAGRVPDELARRLREDEGEQS